MGKYTEEQGRFIRENVKNTKYSDLKDMFNAKFGTDKTKTDMKNYCYRHGLGNGLTNKDTRFKKGHVSHNTSMGNPVGAEVVSGNGQLLVKVRNDAKYYRKNWKAKKVIVWEQYYGKKPKDMMVLSLDGNEMNFDISNLMLIETGENLWLHKTGYIDAEPEVIVSALYYLRLKRQRARREKEIKNK